MKRLAAPLYSYRRDGRALRCAPPQRGDAYRRPETPGWVRISLVLKKGFGTPRPERLSKLHIASVNDSQMNPYSTPTPQAAGTISSIIVSVIHSKSFTTIQEERITSLWQDAVTGRWAGPAVAAYFVAFALIRRPYFLMAQFLDNAALLLELFHLIIAPIFAAHVMNFLREILCCPVDSRIMVHSRPSMLLGAGRPRLRLLTPSI
jgi:hypothetical protein